MIKFCTCVLGLGLATVPSLGADSNAPHVLFLMVDQMDGRVLDPASPLYSIQAMPNLRKLASKGASFVNTYITSPQCVPSRTTMMAGRRNSAIQVWDNSRGIVSVGGDPTILDKHCVAEYGEQVCKDWASIQKAPPTFIDELASGGANVTLYGKLHTGAGLDRFPGMTTSFPFWGAPRKTPLNVNSARAGNYWSRAALINKPPVFAGGIAKKLNVPDDVPLPMGHKDYLTINDCVAALAAGLLAPGQPQQFLYCSIVAPHPPYKSNSTYMAAVDKSLVKVPQWGPLSKVHPADHFMIIQKGDDGIDGVGAAEVEHFRTVYFSRCNAADDLMGRVLKQFETSGDAANTYIVFIADHGESNTEHRMTGKNNMYEASARVPMIIAGPGVPSGTIVNNVASLFDIFPTVLDMAGMSSRMPAGLAGSSVLPLARKLVAPGRKDYVASEYHSFYSATGTFMIRQGDLKLIVFGKDEIFGQDFPHLLFNLTSDPNELNDIASSEPALVQQLRTLLENEIDVNAVDGMCKADNKASFKKFYYDAFGGAKSCMQNMKLLYKGFNATDAARLEKWLGEPCSSSTQDSDGVLV